MLKNNINADINDYEKIGEIGKGASSQVFKVKDNNTDTLYAAKVYYIELEELTKKTQTNLERELNLIQQIDFPSIVNYKGVSLIDFNKEKHPVLIMDYISNKTLANAIKNERGGQPPKNWSHVKKLINIYGIASAISHLHQKGIIHRDLKPSNILETRRFHPKVSDFGLSKFNNQHTRQRQQIDDTGTIFYSAPEVLQQQDGISKTCDIYSFAMIVYSIFTNQEPFEEERKGTTDFKFIMEIAQKNIRPKLTEKVPARFQDLIKKCWCKEPQERLPFSEVVRQLREDQKFLQGLTSDEIEEYRRYIKYIDSPEEYKYEEEEEEVEEEEEKQQDRPFTIENVSVANLEEYEKKEKIGSGAFCNVYKVMNKNGNNLAAKVLIDEFNQNNEKSKRGIYLRREVTILSVSDFPSIMKFVGYSATDFNGVFRPVIVAEFLQNGSLRDVLNVERSGVRIPGWDDTMRLVCIFGIASALKYLHSNGILHRDLKPDNVLLDEHLLPKLSDFGFAKSIEEKEANAGALGTASYMSPEIYTEEEYTTAGDVYAFAMVVYEIMTKTFPFEGLNEFQIMYQVGIEKKNNRPPFKMHVPRAYRELIEACWKQKPEDRPNFDSVVEMLKKDQGFITSAVNKDIFYSYVKYIEELDDTQIEKFAAHDLGKYYKSYREEKDFYSGEGFMDPTDYKDMKSTLKSTTDLFELHKVDDPAKRRSYSRMTANFIVNYSEKSKEIVAIEVGKLKKMAHPAMQKFIAFSFYNKENERRPTILYEYCGDRNLRSILVELQNGNNVPEWNAERKREAIYGIASAMSFLHENEIINPCLNPENIIISEDYRPKLTEYGFHFNSQKSQMSSTQSSLVNLAPIFYMSPELLKANEIDEKSDVYSFGLVAYSILTNKTPARDFEKPEVFEPVFGEDVAEAYRDLIRKCTMKDPSERPEFSEIVESLENAEKFVKEISDIQEYKDCIESVKSGIVGPNKD